MNQTKDEVIGEVREIFADAVAGRDLEHIESRLSIAATKLDALRDEGVKGISRFVISALDSFRQNIKGDKDKAQCYAKALTCLIKDDVSGAESALDDFSVRDFLSKLS